MTILKRIQHIKQQKLDTAESALRKATHKLTQATEVLRDARLELEQYQRWRVEQEITKFQQIQNRQLKLKKVDEMREAIAVLRATEAQKQQHILELEKQKRECELHQTECQRNVHRCEKDVEKYVDVIAQHAVQLQRKKERAADLELEEFASIQFKGIANEFR